MVRVDRYCETLTFKGWAEEDGPERKTGSGYRERTGAKREKAGSEKSREDFSRWSQRFQNLTLMTELISYYSIKRLPYFQRIFSVLHVLKDWENKLEHCNAQLTLTLPSTIQLVDSSEGAWGYFLGPQGITENSNYCSLSRSTTGVLINRKLTDLWINQPLLQMRRLTSSKRGGGTRSQLRLGSQLTHQKKLKTFNPFRHPTPLCIRETCHLNGSSGNPSTSRLLPVS